MTLEYMCISCGRGFVRFNSLQRKCGLCAKNMTAKKPMKKIGKVTKHWISTRNQWVKNNPPDHAGYYVCYLCNRPVHIDEMELDHRQSRSRRPDLRFEQSNLSPTHHTCNTEKGSKSIDIS